MFAISYVQISVLKFQFFLLLYFKNIKMWSLKTSTLILIINIALIIDFKWSSAKPT
jgi:hypothetical protein